MSTSLIKEGLSTVVILLVEACIVVSWFPSLVAHVWIFPLLFLVAVILAFMPWSDLPSHFRARFEIRKIEARFPGMRATKVGGSGNILLTERMTGSTFRELIRGLDF
jgi:fatty acid desaturase